MFMGSDIFEACSPAKLSFRVCKLFVWLALSFRPWAIWKISVGLSFIPHYSTIFFASLVAHMISSALLIFGSPKLSLRVEDT